MWIEQLENGSFRLVKNIIGKATGYIWVDEMIAPVVLELNSKGYKTCSSCSGHCTDYGYYYECDRSSKRYGRIDEEPRIEADGAAVFVAMYGDYSNMTTPDGFKLKVENGITRIVNVIRKPENVTAIGTEDYFSNMKQVLEECEKLYKWAQELPSLL